MATGAFKFNFGGPAEVDDADDTDHVLVAAPAKEFDPLNQVLYFSSECWSSLSRVRPYAPKCEQVLCCMCTHHIFKQLELLESNRVMPVFKKHV